MTKRTLFQSGAFLLCVAINIGIYAAADKLADKCESSESRTKRRNVTLG